MKRIFAAALAALLALSLCACGETESIDTDPDYPVAFSELAELIDAAREEGRLTVCVPEEEPYLTAACTQFEELFGIHVTMRTANASRLPNGADVWYGGSDESCFALSEGGELLAYTPAAAAGLTSADYDCGDYCVTGIDALGIMVNSDVLDRMGISAPRTWDDLLQPVYQGLVWLPAYNTAEGRLFVRAIMEHYGDEAADYLAALDSSVQFYTTEKATAAACLDSGECVIGVGWLSSGWDAVCESGSEVIDLFAPSLNGVPAQMQTTAILADAPHPNAAKLWQEFALSQQCMELSVENGCGCLPTVWDGEVTVPRLTPTHLEVYAAEDSDTALAVNALIAKVMETLAESGVDTEDASRWSVA